MPRQPRGVTTGGWFHVFNRGRNRQAIYLSSDDRLLFLSLLAEMCRRCGVEVHAFVLMTNHFHLLVHSVGDGLSKAMQLAIGRYVQTFNLRHGFDGPLFRGRFRSIPVMHDAYLIELVRYIHLNPVVAGLAQQPGDYPWSSHGAYAGSAPVPRVLRVDTVLEHFGGDRQRFGRFVANVNSPEAVEFRQELKLPVAWSGRRGTPTADEASRQEPVPERLLGLEQLAARLFGVSVEQLRGTVAGQRNDARAAVLTAAHRAGVATMSALAVHYGYRSISSVSSAISRFEARAREDARLAHVIELLVSADQHDEAA